MSRRASSAGQPVEPTSGGHIWIEGEMVAVERRDMAIDALVLDP
jgi:hypothetical protein